MTNQVLSLDQVRMSDIQRVGGKNASLGEMISTLQPSGIRVPPGFATTIEAYYNFIESNNLEHQIKQAIESLDIDNVEALNETGKKIRNWFIESTLPADLEQEIRDAYETLCSSDNSNISVAIRSSATAEDLPEASFAGQQETFLNVHGTDDVVKRVQHVFASLYNDRAIAYRAHQGFNNSNIALSVGIQKMVRSDLGASGVIFTLDTESGFRDLVFITSSFGLGECIVQGSVNPDEFYVHKSTLKKGNSAILRRILGEKTIKMVYSQNGGDSSTEIVETSENERRNFSLKDKEIEQLAQMAIEIERHYERPMDIEWGMDGKNGELYILQARPETVRSHNDEQELQRYKLQEKGRAIVDGRSIGQRIGSGRVRIVSNINELGTVAPGDVLVTDMTDPDWEPVMKQIQNKGPHINLFTED